MREGNSDTALRPRAEDGKEARVSEGVSRRDLLRNSALVAALGSSFGLANVLTAATPASAVGAPVDFAGPDFDLHVLRRTTFGTTPGLVKQVKANGAQAWLTQQLDPASIDDSVCDTLIAQRFPLVGGSIADVLAGIQEFSWTMMFDLGVATIARAAWSKRQLFEVMVDFWANHLNVTNPSDNVWSTRHDYDNNVIRKYAMGKFSDMLRASATHPAMMLYLNNAESTKLEPNENYGRELLELHTVGVGGGYNEIDMRNSALIMTGFMVNWNTYEFRYAQAQHYTGPVKVMGFQSANPSAAGGYQLGLDYVDYLAHHPSTAMHIATQLATRFVSDTPPPSLVSALAATYLANDTATIPMLKQIFASPEFAASIGQKVRRPMEGLVSTLRTLGIKPDVSGTKGMKALYWMLEDLGQPPQAWPQPNGYPDTADAWRSAGGTVARWNSTMSLAAHWWPKQLVLPPLRNLLPRKLPATYGAFVDALSQRLIYRTMVPAHRDVVLTFLGKTAGQKVASTDDAVNWRLPYVVSLILDSPYHQVR